MLRKFYDGEVAIIRNLDFKFIHWKDRFKKHKDPLSDEHLGFNENCRSLPTNQLINYRYIEKNILSDRSDVTGFLIPKELKDYTKYEALYVYDKEPPKSHAVKTMMNKYLIYNDVLSNQNKLTYISAGAPEGDVEQKFSLVNEDDIKNKKYLTKYLLKFEKGKFIKGTLKQRQVYNQNKKSRKLGKEKNHLLPFGTCPVSDLKKLINELEKYPIDKIKYNKEKIAWDKKVRDSTQQMKRSLTRQKRNYQRRSTENRRRCLAIQRSSWNLYTQRSPYMYAPGFVKQRRWAKMNCPGLRLPPGM